MTRLKHFCLQGAALATMAIFLAACGGGGSNSVSTPVAITPPSLPTPPVQATLRGAQPGDILLNQHGFQTFAPKLAVLVRSETPPAVWRVETPNGTVVASGTTQYFGKNDPSGHIVHHIDFSGLKLIGKDYRVKVGTKSSALFVVADRPYSQLAKDSLSYFYQSRAGEAVDEKYVPAQTPPLSRPAAHTDNNLTCFAGTDGRGTVWPSCSHNQDVSGGWYDAGDYGRYVNNTGMAAWTLLNLYERNKAQPNFCGLDYADGSMPIPENANGQNDLLDEARKGVEFILNMQITETSPVAVAKGLQSGNGPLTLTQINTAGLAHHKTHGLDFPPFPQKPSEDIAGRQLYAPSTSATLNVAAIGAQCARIWKDSDPSFSAKCLSAAKTAYTAAKANPDIYAYNNFFGGGPYDDDDVRDVFGWAATELFITTGEAEYQNDISPNRGASYATNGASDYNWQDAHHLGMLSLVTNARGKANGNLSAEEIQAQEDIQTLANNFQAQTTEGGFAIAYEQSNYYWGSNVAMLNRALVMAQAYDDKADERLYSAITSQMDYILGRNPMDASYVSGYGERPMQNPHHRFWANGLNSSYPKPPAGALSGGPNNTAMIDPVAIALKGDCVGQTCWSDEADAYSLNEVAINWNASLVWVSNWLDGAKASCSP